MAKLFSISTDSPGQIGVNPRRVKIITYDDLATVMTAGYLNPAALEGYTIYPTDVIDLYYNYVSATNPGTYSEFYPTISNGIITLNYPAVFFQKGTATTTGGLATVNYQAGVLTTPALTTAAGFTYVITLTDSFITTSSVILLQLMGGTNTITGLVTIATPGNGTATITIQNNNASFALNGTLIIGFTVL
jgi:hypothetical protein